MSWLSFNTPFDLQPGIHSDASKSLSQGLASVRSGGLLSNLTDQKAQTSHEGEYHHMIPD